MNTIHDIKTLNDYCEEDLDLKEEWNKLVQKAIELERESDEIAMRHTKSDAPAQDVDHRRVGQLLTDFLEFRAYFIERCKGRGLNVQLHIGSCAIYALYNKKAIKK